MATICTIMAQASAVSTQTLSELAQFLQTYGGWAVAIILMIAFVAYYRHTNSILEKRNDKFIELLQECSSSLGQVAALLTKVETALRDNKQLLDDARRIMERVDRKLD